MRRVHRRKAGRSSRTSATTLVVGARASFWRSRAGGRNRNVTTRAWHRGRAGNDFALGATRLVQVAPDLWVANMVGQRGIKTGSAGVPIRYEAVERCLDSLAEHALTLGASVHMPRIGCGLAGGTWNTDGADLGLPRFDGHPGSGDWGPGRMSIIMESMGKKGRGLGVRSRRSSRPRSSSCASAVTARFVRSPGFRSDRDRGA